MLKAVITNERRAEITEVTTPKPVADWALVKVLVTPMCTEYKMFVGGGRYEYLGHEAAGEVVEVAQPCGVKPGDRVVVMPQYPCGRCDLCLAGEYIHCERCPNFDTFTGTPEGKATYAQYLLKPAWLLPLAPDDLTIEQASLALCALGPSFGAFDLIRLDALDTVLITGLGPVGLGAVVNARRRGARVIGVESNPWRVERAMTLGAHRVLDPRDPDCSAQVRALTGGGGVDAALDCSGVPAAHRLCIEAARRKGRVAFVGESWEPTTLHVSNDMIRKGLTIVGSWHYNRTRVNAIFDVVRAMPRENDTLVSHVLPMSRIQEAFEISASHECAKILLHPWE
jgi:threonine dehydrogenase-like Zn-dependent dehydrogenase